MSREFFLSWHVAMPMLLAHLLLPSLAFSYFCKYCGVSFRWEKGLCYVLASFGLSLWETACQVQGSLGLLAEILLLMCCGQLLLRKNWIESLSLSVLILSVLSVCSSITSWIGYRILLPLILKYEFLVYPSDTLREGLRVLLICSLAAEILRSFQYSIRQADRQTLIWLTLPVCFIALVVRTIQTSVYGNDMQVNTATGEILTMLKIDHAEFLLLQIFACGCLFAVLSAYQKIQKIFQAEQKIRLLEQQARVQETWLKEALLRERQTRGLRHDMKNHLTVLAELLRSGQEAKAYDYLVRLEEAAMGSSAPVRTGNAAVDALLGSKYLTAGQQKTELQCELVIPEKSGIDDVDWCILLGNGLDNALRACKEIPEQERRIRIYSRKKGSFFLLVIENRCDTALLEAPADGTGLSNIRAVMEKYHGTAENRIRGGTYRLKLLFGSLQQETDTLHPSSMPQETPDDIESEEPLTGCGSK